MFVCDLFSCQLVLFHGIKRRKTGKGMLMKRIRITKKNDNRKYEGKTLVRYYSYCYIYSLRLTLDHVFVFLIFVNDSYYLFRHLSLFSLRYKLFRFLFLYLIYYYFILFSFSEFPLCIVLIFPSLLLFVISVIPSLYLISIFPYHAFPHSFLFILHCLSILSSPFNPFPSPLLLLLIFPHSLFFFFPPASFSSSSSFSCLHFVF